MPHHLEDGYNVYSQPSHVMPDSPSESVCAGSAIICFRQRSDLVGWWIW